MTTGLPDLGWARLACSSPIDEASELCRMLWISVILQAVQDAAQGYSAARRWLAQPSAGRAYVFSMADLELSAFVTRGLPRLQALWADIDSKPRAPKRLTPADRKRIAAEHRERFRRRYLLEAELDL